MIVTIKEHIKHTRQVLDNDQYFMIKTEVFDKRNKLVAKSEVGFINPTLDLEKFKNQFKDVFGKNYRFKILSNIVFKNKEEYEVYKSKI